MVIPGPNRRRTLKQKGKIALKTYWSLSADSIVAIASARSSYGTSCETRRRKFEKSWPNRTQRYWGRFFKISGQSELRQSSVTTFTQLWKCHPQSCDGALTDLNFLKNWSLENRLTIPTLFPYAFSKHVLKTPDINRERVRGQFFQRIFVLVPRRLINVKC
jgi:hypothetical protein